MSEERDTAAAAYLHDLVDLFGLGEWRIWLHWADAPGGDAEADAISDINVRYLRATITVRRDLSDLERLRSVLMHEALHIVLASLDRAAQHIATLVPEALHGHATALYTDAEEQTIERLTRALQRTIVPRIAQD